ncbi:MAG TPA: competence protein CoiA family protein [Saprospiraceae bacterium]|nr:competence protein CoiA family protein [Saprospiraceae bacterium]HMQ85417.1 competence protein CoiA family protein [Saprospiraceae bacterium]
MRIGLDKETKKRIEPKKGAIAICQCCGLDLVPKCGNIKVHHWAHPKGNVCEHWWEPESEWHRSWKNEFPLDWQEVIKYDHENKDKHIADIFNPFKELVIEFQRSPIDLNELKSRERFYEKMIWVVNAIDSNIETFPLQLAENNIAEIELKHSVSTVNSFFAVPPEIQKKLLVKRDEIIKEMMLGEQQVLSLIDLFNKEIAILVNQHETGDRRPDGADQNQFLKDLLHPIFNNAKDEIRRLIKLETDNSDDGRYYGYKWARRQKIWSHAGKPVFLDRGKYLFWLKSEWVLKKLTREEFVEHYSKQEKKN